MEPCLSQIVVRVMLDTGTLSISWTHLEWAPYSSAPIKMPRTRSWKILGCLLCSNSRDRAPLFLCALRFLSVASMFRSQVERAPSCINLLLFCCKCVLQRPHSPSTACSLSSLAIFFLHKSRWSTWLSLLHSPTISSQLSCGWPICCISRHLDSSCP